MLVMRPNLVRYNHTKKMFNNEMHCFDCSVCSKINLGGVSNFHSSEKTGQSHTD